MKGVLFLASHLGSDVDGLSRMLSSHCRIEDFNTGWQYDHYDRIRTLLAKPHKNERSNSIWMDRLLYNHSFICKHLIPYVKMVFLMESPGVALPRIVAQGYDIESAARYYQYRLHGLCEYALRSSGPVLTGMTPGPVFEYLGVKSPPPSEKNEPISPETPVSLVSETRIPDAVMSQSDRCYEHHLGHVLRAGLVIPGG